MAHWFHRNPLKATSPAAFDLRYVASDNNSRHICSLLKERRAALLSILTNPSNEVSTAVTSYTTYLSLLQGFLQAQDGKGGESKLRYLLKFRWGESVLGSKATEMSDVMFEQCSMLCVIGIWFMKHASALAGKDEIAMEEALAVHRSLRIAAGIFKAILEDHVSLLKEPVCVGGDLDRSVLQAYLCQSRAEAQEVTIGRAVELKHKAKLIVGLAHHTHQLFHDAERSLARLPPDVFGKWRFYLLVKAHFYQAYTYTYYSEVLLAEDKCGAAIRVLQEANTLYDKALETCKAYSKCKGPGSTAKPDQHFFFRKLKPVLNRMLDKCVSENGFIYHQKVPVEVVEIEGCSPDHGTVEAEPYSLPPVSPDWNQDVYLAFDITKHSAVVEQSKSSQDPLPQVKEKSVEHSGKDPKNNSGCSVS